MLLQEGALRRPVLQCEVREQGRNFGLIIFLFFYGENSISQQSCSGFIPTAKRGHYVEVMASCDNRWPVAQCMLGDTEL